jgi:hypothetical protein
MHKLQFYGIFDNEIELAGERKRTTYVDDVGRTGWSVDFLLHQKVSGRHIVRRKFVSLIVRSEKLHRIECALTDIDDEMVLVKKELRRMERCCGLLRIPSSIKRRFCGARRKDDALTSFSDVYLPAHLRKSSTMLVHQFKNAIPMMVLASVLMSMWFIAFDFSSEKKDEKRIFSISKKKEQATSIHRSAFTKKFAYQKKNSILFCKGKIINSRTWHFRRY